MPANLDHEYFDWVKSMVDKAIDDVAKTRKEKEAQAARAAAMSSSSQSVFQTTITLRPDASFAVHISPATGTRPDPEREDDEGKDWKKHGDAIEAGMYDADNAEPEIEAPRALPPLPLPPVSHAVATQTTEPTCSYSTPMVATDVAAQTTLEAPVNPSVLQTRIVLQAAAGDGKRAVQVNPYTGMPTYEYALDVPLVLMHAPEPGAEEVTKLTSLDIPLVLMHAPEPGAEEVTKLTKLTKPEPGADEVTKLTNLTKPELGAEKALAEPMKAAKPLAARSQMNSPAVAALPAPVAQRPPALVEPIKAAKPPAARSPTDTPPVAGLPSPVVLTRPPTLGPEVAGLEAKVPEAEEAELFTSEAELFTPEAELFERVKELEQLLFSSERHCLKLQAHLRRAEGATTMLEAHKVELTKQLEQAEEALSMRRHEVLAAEVMGRAVRITLCAQLAAAEAKAEAKVEAAEAASELRCACTEEAAEQAHALETALTDRCEALGARNRRLEAHNRSVEQRNQSLELRYSTLEQSYHALERRTHLVEERNAELEERNHMLEECNHALGVRACMLEERNHNLEECNHTLEARTQTLEERNHNLEQRSHELQAHVLMCEGLHEGLFDQNAALGRRCEQLEMHSRQLEMHSRQLEMHSRQLAQAVEFGQSHLSAQNRDALSAVEFGQSHLAQAVEFGQSHWQSVREEAAKAAVAVKVADSEAAAEDNLEEEAEEEEFKEELDVYRYEKKVEEEATDSALAPTASVAHGRVAAWSACETAPSWAASLLVAEAIAAAIARGAAVNEEEAAVNEEEAEAAPEAAPSCDRYDEAAIAAAFARASYRLSDKGALDASTAAYKSACARLRTAAAAAGVAAALVEETVSDLPNLDLLAEFEASTLTLATESVSAEAAEKAAAEKAAAENAAAAETAAAETAAAEEAVAEKAAAQAEVSDLCAQAERLLTRLKDKQLEEQRQATEEMVDDFLNDVIARASALLLVDEAISEAFSSAAASTDLWKRIQEQNEEVELEWREYELRKGELALVGEPMAISRPPFGLEASHTSPLLSPKLGAIKPISDWSLSLEDPSRFGMESPEWAALPAPEMRPIPMLSLDDAGADDELAAKLAAAAVAQAEAGVQACVRSPPRAEEAAMSLFVAELAHVVAAEVLETAFTKTVALLEAEEAEEAVAAEEEEGEAATEEEAEEEAAKGAIQEEGPSSPIAEEEADALGLLEMIEIIDANDIEAHIHAFEALETEAHGEPNGEDEMVDEDGWQLVEGDA